MIKYLSENIHIPAGDTQGYAEIVIPSGFELRGLIGSPMFNDNIKISLKTGSGDDIINKIPGSFISGLAKTFTTPENFFQIPYFKSNVVKIILDLYNSSSSDSSYDIIFLLVRKRKFLGVDLEKTEDYRYKNIPFILPANTSQFSIPVSLNNRYAKYIITNVPSDYLKIETMQGEILLPSINSILLRSMGDFVPRNFKDMFHLPDNMRSYDNFLVKLSFELPLSNTLRADIMFVTLPKEKEKTDLC